MANQGEIPCASCRSWLKKQKKFSCNPNECTGLTKWLYANAPQLKSENIQLLAQMPDCATQYVV